MNNDNNITLHGSNVYVSLDDIEEHELCPLCNEFVSPSKREQGCGDPECCNPLPEDSLPYDQELNFNE